jgi:hypothetical protein
MIHDGLVDVGVIRVAHARTTRNQPRSCRAALASVTIGHL